MGSAFVKSTLDIPGLLVPSRPVIALFSGGLDSSYLLKLLRDAGVEQTVALAVDLGDDMDKKRLRHRAERFSATLEVVDARQEFARDFVAPAIQAQSLYLGMYPISSSLSRPLMAKVAMEAARRHGAQAILHSAHPSQNSIRRINGALDLLGFDGVYGTPFENTPVTRSVKAAELAEVGITDLATRSISMDTNLWCREFESGEIDDPEQFAVPPGLYKWTQAGAATEPATIAVTFKAGLPVAVDGRRAGLVELVAELNRRAGAHRIGRYIGLEHLAGGEKVLEVREMPAAHVLLQSYAHLLAASVDAETMREKAHVDQLWVREAVEGRWFGRLRAAGQAFASAVSEAVTGTVTVQLRLGAATVTGIRAAAPLYLRNREAWEHEVAWRDGAPGTVDRVARPSAATRP
jgi:argininosuccinate synthase